MSRRIGKIGSWFRPARSKGDRWERWPFRTAHVDDIQDLKTPCQYESSCKAGRRAGLGGGARCAVPSHDGVSRARSTDQASTIFRLLPDAWDRESRISGYARQRIHVHRDMT